MNTDRERVERRLGNVVGVLHWLAGQMAAEGSAFEHVPAGIARSLLGPPAGGRRQCDGPLPAPARTGRPRVVCLSCSPRKTRGPWRVTRSNDFPALWVIARTAWDGPRGGSQRKALALPNRVVASP